VVRGEGICVISLWVSRTRPIRMRLRRAFSDLLCNINNRQRIGDTGKGLLLDGVEPLECRVNPLVRCIWLARAKLSK
jgi:hypothetical protein